MVDGLKSKQDKTNNIESFTLSPLQYFFLKIKQLYMNLPINFSLLTGWRYPTIPRLLGNPIIGRLTSILTEEGVMQNLLAAGKLARNHKSGMCYYWLGNKPVLLITAPEHIQQVLITNDKNVSRRSITRFIELLWGPNIISDPHEVWKKKRSIYVNHLASTKALNGLEESMKIVVNKYLQKLELNKEKSINLQELLGDFSLDMVLNILMPFDATRDTSKYKNYMTFIGENVTNVKNIFKWSLPSVIRKFFLKKNANNLDQIKAQMRNNFKDLILCPYESHIQNTENFIRSIGKLRTEEKLTEIPDVFGDGNALFFAAQDTVANTLEFTIKLLCANPKIEETLRTQLKTHLHDKEFSIENINSVEYLERVIKESLRLFPPSAFFPRAVDHPFKVNNLSLSKGSIIIISPYLTHRRPDIWNEPDQFNPDRFSKENNAERPAHSYIPFGDGIHGCAGWKFAMQELKLLLAAIYMKYHVEIENNDFATTFHRTTMRPKSTTIAHFIPI